MMQDELEQLSKQGLIDLIVLQAAQLAEFKDAFLKLKADYEALKMKFDRNQKPPTSSKNSSQPPSKDQKIRRAISQKENQCTGTVLQKGTRNTSANWWHSQMKWSIYV